MKKGFTLIELLAVIAIIGLLLILVVPNVIKNYNESAVNIIKNQESTVLDIANIMLEDYCKNPVDSTYECPETYKKNKYLCLSDLVNNKLISKNIEYKNEICSGVIIYDEEGNGKTYLACGDKDTGYYTNYDVYNKENYTCK